LSIGEVLEVPVFLLDKCLLVCVQCVLLEVRPVTHKHRQGLTWNDESSGHTRSFLQNKFTMHTLLGLNIGPPEPEERSGSVAATWIK
jgi:hypothetical protein